jgi:hypothetical protein
LIFQAITSKKYQEEKENGRQNINRGQSRRGDRKPFDEKNEKQRRRNNAKKD